MTTKLTLYRGIAVGRDKANEVVATIRSAGIRGDEGWWDFTLEDLRDQLHGIFNKEDRIEDRRILEGLCRRFDAVAISALDPKTLPPLMEKIEDLIHAELHAAPADQRNEGFCVNGGHHP